MGHTVSTMFKPPNNNNLFRVVEELCVTSIRCDVCFSSLVRIVILSIIIDVVHRDGFGREVVLNKILTAQR